MATCSFLCMTSCGCLYGSLDEVNDECIFSEMVEKNHFITYKSVKYSNETQTFYVGLTKQGHPRRVKITNKRIGHQADYVGTLNFPVDAKRLEELEQHNTHLQHHHLRHRHLCPQPQQTQVKDNNWRCQCRKRKNQKKSCPAEHSDEGHSAKEGSRHHKKKGADCKGKKSHKKAGKHSSEGRSKSAHQAASEEEDKEATTPGADDGVEE